MGEKSREMHEYIGQYAMEQGIDLIITEGKEAENISKSAGNKGIHFPDRASLLEALPGIISPGDVVLVKASHGAHFENVAEAIENLK